MTLSIGRTKQHRERGMTLILVAVCLVVLVGMAALAVDLGVLYTARTSAQNAADAGALAGAFVFINDTTLTGTALSDKVKDLAVKVANSNYVLAQPVNITTADVTVDLGNQRVTVVVPRTAARGNAVTTYFARIFGINSSDIAASATAEASKTPSAGRCLKPIFVPNTALCNLPNCSVDDACNAIPPQIIFDPATGGLSTWLKSLTNNGIGMQVNLKPQSPSGSLTPGQFFALDFGSGANTYECTWAKCLNDPSCGTDIALLECGKAYPVKTGDMVGPTRQGVNQLICGATTGNNCAFPADTYVGVGQYDPGGVPPPSSTSRSLATAPVWDNCPLANRLNPGTAGQTAKIVGFAEIFVSGFGPCGGGGQCVQGVMINPIGCGLGGTSTGTGPSTIPLRLVQLPPQ